MSTNTMFYSWLSAQAGVSALVSDRIYPATIPQGATYPCIRFQRDDDGGFKDTDGQGGTIRTDLQLDCVADTLADAVAIAAAVKAVLHGFSGNMATRTVVRTSLDAEFDDYEPNLAEGKFRASQAWTLWHY